MGNVAKIFFIFLLLLLVVITGCKSPWVSSANIYLDQQNNPDKAEEALRKALEQNPNDAEAHFLMGRVHLVKERYAEMAASFNRSLEISPKFEDQIEDIRERQWRNLYNDGGVGKFNERDYEGAIESLELAAVVSPSHWENYYLMGMAFESLRDYKQSAEKYRKATELQTGPKEFNLYYNLSNVLFQLEEYEECNRYAKAIIDETTEDSLRLEAVKISAGALSKLDRSKDAMEMYDQIILASPDDPDPYYDRALLNMEVADTTSAIRDFQRVVELNADDLDALRQLGLIHLDGGTFIDYAKALDYYQKAYALEQPHSYNTVRGIGMALVRLDRAEEATPYLEEATELLKQLKKK